MTRNRHFLCKFSCDLFGLAGIFRRARRIIFKDLVRMRIEKVFKEPLREICAICPHLSNEEFRKVGENLCQFFNSHKDISDEEFRGIVSILPLILFAVWPNINEESMQVLFEVILDEFRDHGQLFKKK